MIPITMIFASIFAMMFVGLSIAVIRKRKALKIPTDTGNNHEMEYALRAHGNFEEYVPLSLLLLIGAELNGGISFLIIGLGCLLLIGRAVHAYGFLYAPQENHFKFRVSGMVLTFISIIILACVNLFLVF